MFGFLFRFPGNLAVSPGSTGSGVMPGCGHPVEPHGARKAPPAPRSPQECHPHFSSWRGDPLPLHPHPL